MKTLTTTFAFSVSLALVLASADAHAEDAPTLTPAPASASTSASASAPSPSPAAAPEPYVHRDPYSLPFQLRPVTAGTVVRSDTSFARYENAASIRALTVVSTLTASYKIPGTGGRGSGLAPVVRFALSQDSPPTGNGGLAIVNPLAGASYAFTLGSGFRASAFLGATIPVGMGGGNSPDPGVLDARSMGAFARAAMDNALFAVNDFTVIPGVDFAWVHGGLTLQIEATLFQLTRVRGEKAQLEATKTNFTSGFHAGWFLADTVSIGGEIRYQRWINAPIAVDKDTTGTLVDTMTFAVGPRFHFELGGGSWIRPGVAYARGLDKPMSATTPNYHIIQLDVPFVF